MDPGTGLDLSQRRGQVSIIIHRSALHFQYYITLMQACCNSRLHREGWEGSEGSCCFRLMISSYKICTHCCSQSLIPTCAGSKAFTSKPRSACGAHAMPIRGLSLLRWARAVLWSAARVNLTACGPAVSGLSLVVAASVAVRLLLVLASTNSLFFGVLLELLLELSSAASSLFRISSISGR